MTEKLPITVLIFHNGALGLVRQLQKMFFGEHYFATTMNRETDFVKLADAFGAKGFRVTKEEELEPALSEAFQSKVPVLIDCIISEDTTVLPMIPGGKSADDIITRL